MCSLSASRGSASSPIALSRALSALPSFAPHGPFPVISPGSLDDEEATAAVAAPATRSAVARASTARRVRRMSTIYGSRTVAPLPCRQMRVIRASVFLAVLTVALAVPLVVLAGGSGKRAAPPTFAFGRTGGNIIPVTVTIAANGHVSTTGTQKLGLTQ